MIETKPCNPQQTKVVLLCGGTSGEREISLVSGAASAEGLRDEGFPVVVIDTADADYREQILAASPDVVFICLHGKGGEDGTVQAVLEEMGLKYTGSGVEASAMAMDKDRAKAAYREAGILTPEAVLVRRGEEAPKGEDLLARMGGKCVIKPATDGSALGVHLVYDVADFDEALADALSLDDKILIEQMIEGTEITVGVLGNEDAVALPIIEIVPEGEFYDFESKYAPGGSTHIIPARISEEATAKATEAAILAHKTLGCRGVSRTDLIVDENDVPWMLETNTIPGMTATSLLPDAARAVGVEFGPLCKMLVELALEN